MVTVTFEADAADYFVEVLSDLCRDSVAVTIVPQTGEPFGAVLLSHDAMTLIYESWDKAAEGPGGQPMTIDIATIARLHVF